MRKPEINVELFSHNLDEFEMKREWCTDLNAKGVHYFEPRVVSTLG